MHANQDVDCKHDISIRTHDRATYDIYIALIREHGLIFRRAELVRTWILKLVAYCVIAPPAVNGEASSLTVLSALSSPPYGATATQAPTAQEQPLVRQSAIRQRLVFSGVAVDTTIVIEGSRVH